MPLVLLTQIVCVSGQITKQDVTVLVTQMDKQICVTLVITTMVGQSGSEAYLGGAFYCVLQGVLSSE
jgi:energy-converting hydrogenase Eha subunit C